MNLPDPGGKNQLAWAQAVHRFLRDLDRRVNSILPRNTRAGEETVSRTIRRPLELLVVKVGEATKIRPIPSTVAGGSSIDLGFSEGDDPVYLLSPSVGIFVAGFTYDTSTKAVTSRWLEILSEIPAPEDGTAYVEIGTVSIGDDGTWHTVNSRYGPIDVIICQNWATAEAPFFTVSFFSSLS